MPNGRDGKIVSKYTPKHFLLSKKMQKTNEAMTRETKLPSLDDRQLVPTFNEEPPKGIKEALDMGLKYVLSNRKKGVEDEFGVGSMDWMLKNLNQFTTEEKYRLHDMFYQFPGEIDASKVK